MENKKNFVYNELCRKYGNVGNVVNCVESGNVVESI